MPSSNSFFISIYNLSKFAYHDAKASVACANLIYHVKSNDPQNTTFGKVIHSLFTNESIDVVDFLVKLFKIDNTKDNNKDKQQ